MNLRALGHACVELKRSYCRLQYDDMRFAQNELERNWITRAHTNVSNLSFTSDHKCTHCSVRANVYIKHGDLDTWAAVNKAFITAEQFHPIAHQSAPTRK